MALPPARTPPAAVLAVAADGVVAVAAVAAAVAAVAGAAAAERSKSAALRRSLLRARTAAGLSDEEKEFSCC